MGNFKHLFVISKEHLEQFHHINMKLTGCCLQAIVKIMKKFTVIILRA